MTEIRSFNQLSIKQPDSKSFVGEKIKFKNILGKEIIVHDYKIGPSDFDGLRLDMQITFNNEKRVVWTGSGYLRETMEGVKPEQLPFKTIIIQEENDRYRFT